jgi:hypothetical protein
MAHWLTRRYAACVGISVRVLTDNGMTEALSTHPGIGRVCLLAEESAFPMLGYVDPYGDTTFNRSQMRLVIPELRALIERGTEDESDAAREILTLAERVEHDIHTYLVFEGD